MSRAASSGHGAKPATGTPGGAWFAAVLARVSPRARLAARRARAEAVDALPVRDRFEAARPGRVHGFDHALALGVAALVLLGVLMVYSASVALPDSPKYARYEPTHFLVRHALAIGLGLCAAAVTLRVPVDFWEKHAGLLFVLALVLLVLVLILLVLLEVQQILVWKNQRVVNYYLVEEE